MTRNSDPPEGRGVILLSPGSHILEINGKLFYSEGDRSWNILRLRKEVLHEFPELKKRSSALGYKMIIPKSKENFKKILEGMKESLPILLFFHKEQP